MTAVARIQGPGARQAMLAKIHIAAKDLRIAEDDRRDLMERVTGHRSAKDCSDDQLHAVLEELKRVGFQAQRPAKAPARPKRADSPIAGKARAMWISLHHLGAVRSPAEPALEAFAKRQLGVDRLAWADQQMGYRLIEALKAMAERAGWSQDLTGIDPAKHVLTLKRRLVQRQAEILGREPFRIHDMDAAALDRLARENAAVIRATRTTP